MLHLLITNHHETNPTGVRADSLEQLDTMYLHMRTVFEAAKFDIEESENQFVVRFQKVSKLPLITVRKIK